MRVLEVEIFGRGGLTHYVYNLSTALAGTGADVTIATAADYELEAKIRTLPEGVHVDRCISRLANRVKRRVPGRALRKLKGVEFLGDAISLAVTARRLDPDVIHVHCTNAIAVWLLTLLRAAGRPIVWTAHDLAPHEPVRGERFVQRAIYRLADHVIVHGEGDRERLAAEHGIDGHRVSVIPHGDYAFFDTGDRPSRSSARAWLGLPDDADVALFFGFIREYKGLDVLLDAWSSVAANDPNRRLVIAGDPARLDPARARMLQARAAELGAVHHFRYIPFEDVPKYFTAADVLVLPYRRISQSGVLLLAMSMGVAVVASRVGAFPEVLTHGENGMLLPPGDADALADALDQVLGDAALRARMAANAAAVARARYSWGAIAERTSALFERLAPDRADAGAGQRMMTNG